jgi:hypothetical protein
MTNKRRDEILAAFKLLNDVNHNEWMTLMRADYDKLPYRLSEFGDYLGSAVRELCPPGFEIDR